MVVPINTHKKYSERPQGANKGKHKFKKNANVSKSLKTSATFLQAQ